MGEGDQSLTRRELKHSQFQCTLESLGEDRGVGRRHRERREGRICINIIHLVLQKPKCCCELWREALAVASCLCYLLAQLSESGHERKDQRTPLLPAPATSSICSANLNWKIDIYIYIKKKTSVACFCRPLFTSQGSSVAAGPGHRADPQGSSR